ncbi:hypothetical protein EGW08_023112 [Elysia chlorotica]|uniref:Glycoside hydrolase 35 catalytic domain-containing protein n=1 Tax=Elysia chlorotica TaxID=188477 RepID=A0A3S1BK78_ELYCH|nr:hypothetical protein EGW08_023112 [Elysia chlorotica]
MATRTIFTFSATLFLLTFLLSESESLKQPTFEIDYENDTFMKDGKPFRYVSGSFHYSRVHPFYWKDRLVKTRAAGVNTIQVYVPWNVHELTSGKFSWDGASDLPRFLTLAQEADLAVLLRLGPYICGEWEFGGFPAWLLTANASMVLRTSDPSYMKYVDRWFTALLAKVKPFLYNNGGPILMVQTENEYGSYFACDFVYLKYLRDKVLAALGEETVLYSTDGDGAGYLKCGKVDGVYATVDFGITTNPAGAFNVQREFEPKGPLVNSEFYTGWLDHWGSKHSTVGMVPLANSLDLLLNYSNSTNINM